MFPFDDCFTVSLIHVQNLWQLGIKLRHGRKGQVQNSLCIQAWGKSLDMLGNTYFRESLVVVWPRATATEDPRSQGVQVRCVYFWRSVQELDARAPKNILVEGVLLRTSSDCVRSHHSYKSYYILLTNESKRNIYPLLTNYLKGCCDCSRELIVCTCIPCRPNI